MRSTGSESYTEGIESSPSVFGVTKSGIVLPGSAQEKPHQGEVVAVGSGYVSQATGQRIPLEIKVGDRVVYGRNAGIDVKFDGEELLLMSESEVLVVLE